MRGPAKIVVGPLIVLALVLGLLLAGSPGSAQTRELGSCVADGAGTFPSSLGCVLRIPNGTVAGEYNLVGRCPAGGAAAQSPYFAASSSGPLGVSSNRLAPGQEFTASGTGCRANALVTFTLERLGALISIGNPFTGVAFAQDGTRTLTARVTVVGEGDRAAAAQSGTQAARGGSLARTGFQVLPWLSAGLLAIVVGGGLVMAGRRRTAKTSAADGS